jgi:hypothetical protein
MARKTRGVEMPGGPPRKRGRRRRASTGDSPKPTPEKEQGFLFDAYWDEAFSAYYDPTLRTCCQLRY